ncbi:MAG: dihydroneopterin aldolase [Gammaproteobacteria bacterium]|nr:MAG: dihydroneopterin aldolase [Gammaproteobacteria bacterium]
MPVSLEGGAYSVYSSPIVYGIEQNGMDIIFIRDLRIDTVIGIYDWERSIKQTLHIDLEMATDIAKAAASDQIEDTLNYKAVAKRVITFVEESSFQLVETLAERIVELVREEFSVSWVRLVLNKGGAVRGARGVGVIIERGAAES